MTFPVTLLEGMQLRPEIMGLFLQTAKLALLGEGLVDQRGTGPAATNDKDGRTGHGFCHIPPNPPQKDQPPTRMVSQCLGHLG